MSDQTSSMRALSRALSQGSGLRDIQVDFSGGEVGGRMLLREDTDLHDKAALTMLNWYPTLQGTMQRTPATRFAFEALNAALAPAVAVRLFPYSTPDNKNAMVVMQPKVGATLGNIEVNKTINVFMGSTTIAPLGDINPLVTATSYKYLVENGKLNGGFDGWDVAPNQWTSNDGWSYGWTFGPDGYQNQSYLSSKGDNAQGKVNTMKGSFTTPEAVTHIILTPELKYVTNFSELPSGGAMVNIYIGTTSGGSEIANIDLSFMNPDGVMYNRTHVINYAFAAGTKYYITLRIEAVALAGNSGDNGKLSQPFFVVYTMDVAALVTYTVDNSPLVGVVPYTEAELESVHYVQSPYTATSIGGVGKEMVFTHPNHPPKRLYFNGTNFVFEDIFTNDVVQFYLQWFWADSLGTILNGYPATCGSYNGRLVLGGSTVDPVVNSPNGSNTETVWCTEVGDWAKFSDPDRTEILPTDSVTFTGIYRSPIKWVIGQKELLVGAEAMEYTASADGIFGPGDLGVQMQSTHGSNAVQPVPMGPYVLFPSENGKHVRAMRYVAQDEGWVAPDMTISHPHLFASGIRRMVRLRNPHQMMVAVMGNGQLALLHHDLNVGITAWSRMNVGGTVLDAMVSVDDNGADILYLAVARRIDGIRRIYIEAIGNWIDGGTPWSYQQCWKSKVGLGVTNVIDGLNHFGHQYVHVMIDGRYLGTHFVDGGEITLTDDVGNPLNYNLAVVGYASTSTFLSMPLIKNPGAKKRHTSLKVTILDSIRPIINGVRPPDRDPRTPLDISQTKMLTETLEVGYLPHSQYQQILIEETLPFRVEIMGIFGKITENNV